MNIGPLGIVSIEPIYPMNNSSNNIYFPLNERKRKKANKIQNIQELLPISNASRQFEILWCENWKIKCMQNESIFIVQIQYCCISIACQSFIRIEGGRERERNRKRLNSKSRMSEVSLSVYYLSKRRKLNR